MSLITHRYVYLDDGVLKEPWDKGRALKWIMKTSHAFELDDIKEEWYYLMRRCDKEFVCSCCNGRSKYGYTAGNYMTKVTGEMCSECFRFLGVSRDFFNSRDHLVETSMKKFLNDSILSDIVIMWARQFNVLNDKSFKFAITNWRRALHTLSPAQLTWMNGIRTSIRPLIQATVQGDFSNIFDSGFVGEVAIVDEMVSAVKESLRFRAKPKMIVRNPQLWQEIYTKVIA